MSNLIPTEISLLRDRVKVLFPGLSRNEIISRLLDRPLVDNPISPTQTLKLLKTKDFFGKLVGGDKNKVFNKNEADIAPLVALINNQDRNGILNWLDFLLDKALISQNSYDALSLYLKETTNDPNYSTKILGQNQLSQIIGREMNALDGTEVDQIVDINVNLNPIR